MTDIFDKEKRSKITSNIKSKDTTIELVVRKHLFANGFRYRKNDKRLPGKPDIVLPKYKTVIFIHGCFWHGHGMCIFSHKPKSRITFWEDKINKNIERDLKHQQQLKIMGWKVIVLWECQIKKNTEKCLSQLILKINSLDTSS